MQNSLNKTFTLRAPKQHDDTYRFKVTQNGWNFGGSGPANVGECDKYGDPHFFGGLKQNHFTYPSDLGHYLCLIHEHAIDGTKSEDEIQGLFNSLSEYLLAVDAVNKPEIEPSYE